MLVNALSALESVRGIFFEHVGLVGSQCIQHYIVSRAPGSLIGLYRVLAFELQ